MKLHKETIEFIKFAAFWTFAIAIGSIFMVCCMELVASDGSMELMDLIFWK